MATNVFVKEITGLVLRKIRSEYRPVNKGQVTAIKPAPNPRVTVGGRQMRYAKGLGIAVGDQVCYSSGPDPVVLLILE